jgi:hypothetical protein
MNDQRNLTDADVAALVDAFEVRMTDKFYRDLGKGFWGMVWKAVVLACIAMAAYGAWKGGIK